MSNLIIDSQWDPMTQVLRDMERKEQNTLAKVPFYKRKPYSRTAKGIVFLARQQGIKIWSDPDWSLVEAGMKETPQGEVHLHWKNHRGNGRWVLVQNWRGEICGTVRCRKVTIIPHGGENESVAVKQFKYNEVLDSYMAMEVGGIVRRGYGG